MKPPSCVPRRSNVVVVLVSARNPLNIGAAARAMSNFGFKQLRVVNPFTTAFREAKSALGASAVLKNAQEYKSIAEGVADCSLVIGTTAARNRKLEITVRTPKEGGRLLRKTNPSSRVALLFGSEKRGLSNEDLSYCHWLIRIPTLEENPSMNLGQSVAVCLYELARDPTLRAETAKPSLAKSAELDRMMELLLDGLRTSGYIASNSAHRTEEKLRRLIRRLELSGPDAERWLGMLRQMLWKMRSGN
jgi:TrmH family RNA methyltransferase